jgi:Ice-binding-like
MTHAGSVGGRGIRAFAVRHQGARQGPLILPVRAGVVAVLAVVVLMVASTANAAEPTVGLGTAKKFAVLAGQGVTNTGPSVVNGWLGTSPNPSVTGFPPGIVHGQIHKADAVALQAQSDLTTAYNDAAGRSGLSVIPQLGGQTLTPGVYTGGALDITGTLTLDGPGVYIFQASSSLVTATGSSVSLINGADPCDVFWQVTSSATLNGPEFVGTVMALTSITVGNGVHVQGRLLAGTEDVTLINDVIDSAACGGSTTPSPTPSSQVSVVPSGGIQTGGGSTAGVQSVWLFVFGGALLAVAGAAFVMRRRAMRSD